MVKKKFEKSDLKKMSRQQLQKRLQTLRTQLSEQHQQLRAGSQTNVRQPRLTRRKIAQTLTQLNRPESKQAKEGGK